MPTNQFLPFAIDSGANVMPQSTYAALAARLGGFTAGVASSAAVNKALRQSAFIASVVGDFIAKNADQDLNDNGNPASALALMEAAHRNLVSFTDSRTFNVPGDFATLQEGVLAIATRFIPSTVTIVFNLAAGDHIVDSTTGSIILNNPFGARIRIVGQPLAAAFPTEAQANNSAPSTVEAFLRTVWPTRIVVSGNRQGIFLQAGDLGRLENVLMIGDRTSGQHGFMAGEWQGEMGTGTVRFINCWFHNFGTDGLRMNYGSFALGFNVGASHCVENGFRVANISGLQVGGSWISTRNLVAGLMVRDQSFAEAIIASSAAFTLNGNNGILLGPTGAFVSSGAAALNIGGNTGYGCVAALASYADFPTGAVGVSNTIGGVLANAGSQVFMNGGVALTTSPTRGSTGNANSYTAA